MRYSIFLFVCSLRVEQHAAQRGLLLFCVCRACGFCTRRISSCPTTRTPSSTHVLQLETLQERAPFTSILRPFSPPRQEQVPQQSASSLPCPHDRDISIFFSDSFTRRTPHLLPTSNPKPLPFLRRVSTLALLPSIFPNCSLLEKPC